MQAIRTLAIINKKSTHPTAGSERLFPRAPIRIPARHRNAEKVVAAKHSRGERDPPTSATPESVSVKTYTAAAPLRSLVSAVALARPGRDHDPMARHQRCIARVVVKNDARSRHGGAFLETGSVPGAA